MSGIRIPYADLRVGQWAYLESCGVVRVVGLVRVVDDNGDPDYVSIAWSAVGSSVGRKYYQPVQGFWSGRHDDFPTFLVYPEG